ncbi:MAG: gamma-glutamyl-phosphate reductase, partial [Balneolaceae bacterium]
MSQNIQEQVHQIGRQAREASRQLTALSEEQKNAALEAIATAIEAHRKKITEENEKDVAEAKKNGLTDAMTDRLVLNEKRMNAMIQGVRDIAALPDPVGRSLKSWTKENGMKFTKLSVPIGVIGMIYESRPNVTADAAALCLKASNAIILRGGS